MKWKQAHSVCKGPEGPFWWMSNGVTSKADPWKLQNTWCRFLHFGDFMMLKRDFVPKVNWCSIHNTPVMSHVLPSKLAEANDPQLTIRLAHWQILTLTMEQVLWTCDSFLSFLLNLILIIIFLGFKWAYSPKLFSPIFPFSSLSNLASSVSPFFYLYPSSPIEPDL